MIKMLYKVLLPLLGMVFLCIDSEAQNSYCYEFESNSLYKVFTHTCPVHRYGDSVLVVSNLFNEMNISNQVVFTFRDSCVFLTINGQEKLFFGDSRVGNWNTTGNESERFTIKWDTLFCSDYGEILYKFEFSPYYSTENPLILDDGTVVVYNYCDMVSYYWTYSAGVVAMEGDDLLFVRKDQNFVKSCLKNIKRCSGQ